MVLLLLNRPLNDMEKGLAEVIETFFAAILLVAEMNVGNVYEAHRQQPPFTLKGRQHPGWVWIAGMTD